MRTRLATALGVAALSAVSILVAQEPVAQEPQPGPTFRAGVELVRVDISVRGEDGTPITDLTAADFEVTEDGQPQEVTTVQLVEIDGERTSDLDESLEIRSPEHARLEALREDVRLFAIFLDDYHVDKEPRITRSLRKALVAFVERLGPNDLIAVMDPLTPLTHLEFTRSRADLIARMRSFEGRFRQTFPVRSILEEGQLRGRATDLRAEVTLSALEALAIHLGGLREGRKSVLFVSQGPPVQSASSPNQRRLDEVVEAANRGNVTIHVLDPRPLGSSPMGGSEAAWRLSQATGGRAIANTNDPTEDLAGVVSDASTYYLIGYVPSRAMHDGRYHAIDVRVKRRGARVVARRGYYAPSEEEMTVAATVGPAVAGLDAALEELHQPVSGALVDVWVGATRGADGQNRLTVVWEATARATQPAAAPTSLEVEPLDPVDGAALTEPATITPSSGAGRSSAAASFDVGPGPVQLRFTLKDHKGDTLDRWARPWNPPTQAGALSLATPRFLRARSAFEYRALEGDPSPTPSATRRFDRTDRVLVDIEAYGSGQAERVITAELLNQAGDKLRDLPVPVPIDGRTRIVIPVQSLAPSRYVLRVQATSGEQTARHLEAFRVGPS